MVFWFFGLARVGVQSCGPCGVCLVERQPLRVAENAIGHERALNGLYEGNRSGWVMGGGCVHTYIIYIFTWTPTQCEQLMIDA